MSTDRRRRRRRCYGGHNNNASWISSRFCQFAPRRQTLPASLKGERLKRHQFLIVFLSREERGLDAYARGANSAARPNTLVVIATNSCTSNSIRRHRARRNDMASHDKSFSPDYHLLLE